MGDAPYGLTEISVEKCLCSEIAQHFLGLECAHIPRVALMLGFKTNHETRLRGIQSMIHGIYT